MHSVVEEAGTWFPSTGEEKEEVRRQMHRLLETSHFRNSRRYPALFRFVVEETLEGRGEFLKERLLGVRVFNRPADYDTAADPIVRVTIAEIRKRIAQYYHEEAHETEMRIELLPGRYEPEFRPRKEAEANRSAAGRELEAVRGPVPPAEVATVALPLAPVSARPAPLGVQSGRGHRFSRAMLWIFGATAVILLVGGGLSLKPWVAPTALQAFWAPILGPHQAITFCIPNGAGRSPKAASVGVDPAAAPVPTVPRTPSSFLDQEAMGENVVFSDVLATIRVSDFLARHDAHSKVRLDVSTTLDDLRQGPTVLIGGLDNQWTMRALAPLRFQFAGIDRESFWIADQENPGNRNWSLDLRSPVNSVTRDYALVARLHDEATGEVEVIVAGIGMSATAAAGEFLVDPQQMEELRRRVGPGFRNRDFEAVLSTDVVNGSAGPAKVLRVAVW